MRVQAAKNALASTPERRVAFPADIFGEKSNGVEPRLTSEISQSRQSLDGMFTEQLST
jgi:hypothetical protein